MFASQAPPPPSSSALPTAMPSKLQSFLAGWFGGVCVTAVCHPFDAVKVHSQVQHMTPVKAALNLWQENGAASLYRGIVSPMTGVGLAYAMKFGVYGNLVSYFTEQRVKAVVAETEENFRKKQLEIERQLAQQSTWVKTWRSVKSVVVPTENEEVVPGIDPADLRASLKNAGRLPFHVNVGCAAAGGVAEALVMTPFEVVKLRLLTESIFNHREYHGAWDCAKTLIREGGPQKLWLGLGATILRDVPAAVIFFGAYGTLRAAVLPASSCTLEDAPSSLIAGAVAGALTWCVVLPLDCIKTHMQTSNRRKGDGMLQIMRNVYREGGIRAFYVGWGPALFRASFANAILLTGVETSIRLSRLVAGLSVAVPGGASTPRPQAGSA